MKTLKREEVHLLQYEDQGHARCRLAHFLDTVYNTKRLHSRLGYAPPAEFEAHWLEQQQLFQPEAEH